MRIADVMEPVVRVQRDASVASVAAIMLQQRTTMVIVTNHAGDAIGIVTERDLLDPPSSGLDRGTATATLAPPAHDLATRATWPAHRLMHPIPSILRADEPVEKVLELMLRRGFRHMAVLEGDKPVGMIGPQAFLRLLTTSTLMADA